MKRYAILLSAVLVLGGTAACGDDKNQSATPSASDTKTVTLALGGPFSGSSKPTGDKIRAGAQLAATEINDSGGIKGGPLKGAKIAFKEFDDAGQPQRGATNMRTIVDDNELLAFVGSGTSDVSVAMAPTASETGFPFLSSYGSSPKILEAATNKKSVFVVPPTFPAYAFSVTDELVKAGHNKPAIINLTGTYGDGVADLVVTRLKENNITPVAKESFGSNDTDFRTQLAKIKAANPDSLVMVGLANLDALILQQADELGLKVPVFDPGGITNNDTFLKTAGPLANGVVGNTPTYADRATPATQSLRAAYSKATGESVVPDPAVFSYEGVLAIAEALALGGSTREDLPEHIRKVDIADTGVGSLKFAPDGSRIGGRLYIFKITDGKPAYITSYEQTGPTSVKEIPLGG